MKFGIPCSGIYKIENKKTGLVYIGLSVDIFSRFSQHYSNMKMNKHSSPKLSDDLSIYGIESFTFEVLEYVSKTKLRLEYKSRLDGNKFELKLFEKFFKLYLLQLEKKWMSKYSINNCYNKNNKSFK